jgi:hypothetical protein
MPRRALLVRRCKGGCGPPRHQAALITLEGRQGRHVQANDACEGGWLALARADDAVNQRRSADVERRSREAASGWRARHRALRVLEGLCNAVVGARMQIGASRA